MYIFWQLVLYYNYCIISLDSCKITALEAGHCRRLIVKSKIGPTGDKSCGISGLVSGRHLTWFSFFSRNWSWNTCCWVLFSCQSFHPPTTHQRLTAKLMSNKFHKDLFSVCLFTWLPMWYFVFMCTSITLAWKESQMNFIKTLFGRVWSLVIWD